MGESLFHPPCLSRYLSVLFLVLKNHFMCQIGNTEGKMPPNDEQQHHQQSLEEFTNGNNQIKYFVDLYTATLHLR